MRLPLEFMSNSTPRTGVQGVMTAGELNDAEDKDGPLTTLVISQQNLPTGNPVSAQKLKDHRRGRLYFTESSKWLFRKIKGHLLTKGVAGTDSKAKFENIDVDQPLNGLLAPRRGIIGVTKKDPLGNCEVVVRIGIIVDDCSDIDLISPLVVDELGLADDIQSCNISCIEGVSGEMKGRIKGVLRIKFLFVEDAVGIFPGYQKHYFLWFYVLEDANCHIDTSVCGNTAEKLGWNNPKHMGTGQGSRAAPSTKNPGTSLSTQVGAILKNKDKKAKILSGAGSSSSPRTSSTNTSSNLNATNTS